MFPGLGECSEFAERCSQNKNRAMHPDAGAIIGISLAGSVLIVALIFLCVLQFCCKDQWKPARNRRNTRPSTSSRTAFSNFGFSGSSRDVRTLSAADLQNQNRQNHHSAWTTNTNTPVFNNPAPASGTGILNSVWHLNCHACGAGALAGGSQLTAPCHIHSSQVSLSRSNPCLFCCQENDIRNNPRGHDFANRSPPDYFATDGSISSSRFQYFSPQLLSPSESPPPYPGRSGPDCENGPAERNNMTNNEAANSDPVTSTSSSVQDKY